MKTAAVLLVALAAPLQAQIPEARRLIAAFMESGNVPGVSVAVGVNGQVVWSEGFGFADVEQRVAVTPETKFRIGSVSKSLTAAALGQLHERGRLELDAEVQKYVPSFPRKRWPITVRQVAGHIAGVRHYQGDENDSYRPYATVMAGLDIFDDDTLLFEPGTKYSYSSYGWNLLSAVVETASGQNFLTYMRGNVFEPLGMRNTTPDFVDSIIPHRTEYYGHTRDDRVINARAVDNSYKWAGGGFLSTPEDLLKFAFTHLNPGFLKPETVTLLWTSQKLRSGEETGYGMGWVTRNDPAGHHTVGHGGGSVGGTTLLLIHPASRVVLAIVANLSGAQFRDLPGRLAELWVR